MLKVCYLKQRSRLGLVVVTDLLGKPQLRYYDFIRYIRGVILTIQSTTVNTVKDSGGIFDGYALKHTTVLTFCNSV